MHRALAWITLLAISFSIAFLLTCAVGGSAPSGNDERATRVSTPDSTQQGPSCTWIGAYCAFPDR
jgi:hypothetical protein